MAWCIVPFDAAKRGPEARAAMLEKLGIHHFAYDYRAEHVPTFEAEVDALAKHHVHLSAWWFPTTMNDEARGILELLHRKNLTPQLWVMCSGAPAGVGEDQNARVAAMADRFRPIAEAAAKIGCKVGLYNHGGWAGEPRNMLAILHKLELPNVGIVYNLHHAHDQLDPLVPSLAAMKPHLLCVNLNGTDRDGEATGRKILPLGTGALDLQLLRTLRDSGYEGPFGLLNHTDEDAEKRLAANLKGLDQLTAELDQPMSAFTVRESAEEIRIAGDALDAIIRKKGYVTGVAAQSLLDRKTGFRDAGYGLDIVDWIMEPGSDADYREQLPKDLRYEFGNAFHGQTAKRSIEGPQICTQAKELSPQMIRGKDFVAVKTSWKYSIAAPGKQTGSQWDQTMVFPAGKRYFISSDRMTSVNASDALFFRLDMPGHIKHKNDNTFSEVYLSYAGLIPASAFAENFAPDVKFNFRRDANPAPKRFIRAYHLKDARTGQPGPWLAGMTLNVADVYEAWCHERGYVCMIEEIGGHKTKPGDTFGAAFIVGYFDSIQEMEKTYDAYAGKSVLEADETGWRLK